MRFKCLVLLPHVPPDGPDVGQGFGRGDLDRLRLGLECSTNSGKLRVDAPGNTGEFIQVSADLTCKRLKRST